MTCSTITNHLWTGALNRTWWGDSATYCFSTSSTMRSMPALDGTWVPWIRLLEVGWKSSPLWETTRAHWDRELFIIIVSHDSLRSRYVSNVLGYGCWATVASVHPSQFSMWQHLMGGKNAWVLNSSLADQEEPTLTITRPFLSERMPHTDAPDNMRWFLGVRLCQNLPRGRNSPHRRMCVAFLWEHVIGRN